MKLFIVVVAIGAYAALALFNPSATAKVSPWENPTEVYTLSKDGAEKEVPFNHANHATKNYNVEGTAPIACAECHHTQKELTLANTKDIDVQECRSCHARDGEKPKVGDAIPTSKVEGNTDPTTWTNEEAYHRNCGDCHDAASTARKTVKAPASTDCKGCHTGAK